MAAPESPLLGVSGAVEGAGADAGVAAHYGSPLREQRLLEAGRAIVDLSHLAILELSGEDRLSWLDSITSQSIAKLAPGESAETLVLDPHGHVEHSIRLVDDGEKTLMILENEQLEPLAAWLKRMRFTRRVDITERPDLAALASWRDPVADVTTVAVWRETWREVAAGGTQYATAEENLGAHPGEDFDLVLTIVPRAELSQLATRTLAGTLALEASRVAAWRPRWGFETDERLIPHEVDWLRSAVHLSKGCYRGQETVAKVHNLGHPPRRLVALHFDGSDAVFAQPGDELFVYGDDSAASVGAVTSAAMHTDDGAIGLALVRRNLPTDSTLTFSRDGAVVTALQTVVVPPDAGKIANVPRMPRLGRVKR